MEEGGRPRALFQRAGPESMAFGTLEKKGAYEWIGFRELSQFRSIFFGKGDKWTITAAIQRGALEG